MQSDVLAGVLPTLCVAEEPGSEEAREEDPLFVRNFEILQSIFGVILSWSS